MSKKDNQLPGSSAAEPKDVHHHRRRYLFVYAAALFIVALLFIFASSNKQLSDESEAASKLSDSLSSQVERLQNENLQLKAENERIRQEYSSLRSDYLELLNGTADEKKSNAEKENALRALLEEASLQLEIANNLWLLEKYVAEEDHDNAQVYLEALADLATPGSIGEAFGSYKAVEYERLKEAVLALE